VVRSRVNWPLIPPVAAVLLFLIVPLLVVFAISMQPSGSSLRRLWSGTFQASFENYAVFLDRAYIRYLWDTLWLSFLASAISIVAAYPIAYWLARARSSGLRKAAISLLMVVLYSSAILKVYGVALVFGPTGFRGVIAAFWDVGPASRLVTATVVVIGLINFLLPIAALVLVGPLQQVDPSLADVAASLGANRIVTHLTVLVPVCLRGIGQVFMLIYASSISAFVIPSILGRGQVAFLANLVYARFSEVSDFSGGSALSILLLAVTLGVTLGLGSLFGRQSGRAGRAR